MRIHRIFLVPLVCALLASCSLISLHGNTEVTGEATPASYTQNKNSHGLVLLDARWGRQWSCGKFQNAELRGFAFDRLPLSSRANEAPADLTISTSRSLINNPRFQSYALLVQPGEYALTGSTIKVAQSVSEVGYLTLGRADLVRDDEPVGGTFKVAAGEAVYIGNFALDCQLKVPTLWRYYTEGKDGFRSHLADYQAKYPFLDLRNVTYRLFETKEIGRPYALE
ncbi:hypothetical protein D9M68_717660 [compost metagenome]